MRILQRSSRCQKWDPGHGRRHPRANQKSPSHRTFRIWRMPSAPFLWKSFSQRFLASLAGDTVIQVCRRHVPGQASARSTTRCPVVSRQQYGRQVQPARNGNERTNNPKDVSPGPPIATTSRASGNRIPSAHILSLIENYSPPQPCRCSPKFRRNCKGLRLARAQFGQADLSRGMDCCRQLSGPRKRNSGAAEIRPHSAA